MGSMNEVGKNKSAGLWFLGKVLRHPASYVGLAAAIGVGVAASAAAMPVGGVIGFATMVGLAVGMLGFLVGYGIKASHRQANDNEDGAPRATLDPALLAELREVEEGQVATVLEKLLGDRNAIAQLVAENPDNEDAGHTLGLVSRLLTEAVNQAEELQDLARRGRDPLLEAGKDAEAKSEAIRGQIECAYRAVADTRSRLRRGEKLLRRDFLEPAAASSLPALTEQLAGETEIARRVEERIRSDFGNVVFESEEPESPQETGEESWERE